MKRPLVEGSRPRRWLKRQVDEGDVSRVLAKLNYRCESLVFIKYFIYIYIYIFHLMVIFDRVELMVFVIRSD